MSMTDNSCVIIRDWRNQSIFLLEPLLLDHHFVRRFSIGWRLCCQQIQSHVGKLLLANAIRNPSQIKISSIMRSVSNDFTIMMTSSNGNIFRVTGEFPAQRPVTRSFNVFFDLRLNKRLSKQSWGWWSETQLRSLWRHCNGIFSFFRWHPHHLRLLILVPVIRNIYNEAPLQFSWYSIKHWQ